MLQTDGGYLGSDFEAFFSAVVSGAAGVYVGVLLQDAGIETDLVVRPGQRVSVSGDRSLPRPPRWGGGGFSVQQRGSLSLSFVEVLGAFSASGSLSLAQMAVTSAQFVATFLVATPTPGSLVRLSEVTVPARETWTASLSVGADGVVVFDPTDFFNPSSLVRSPLPTLSATSPDNHASAWAGYHGSSGDGSYSLPRPAAFSPGLPARATLCRYGPTATRSAAAETRGTAGCSAAWTHTVRNLMVSAPAVTKRGRGGPTRRSATGRRSTSGAVPCCSVVRGVALVACHTARIGTAFRAALGGTWVQTTPTSGIASGSPVT